MIKLSEWDKLYRHNIDFAIRRMEPYCLELYKDTQQDWVDALFAFNKLQEDLFKLYGLCYKSGTKYKRDCIKGFVLTADQLFEIFHLHINRYTNYTVRYFLFKWWNDLRYFILDAQPPLDCAYKYFRPAIKKEIEQARKDFEKVEEKFYEETKVSTHHFRDDAQVLEYRGNRFIIDNEWGDAWTKNKKGEVVHFQLIYDW